MGHFTYQSQADSKELYQGDVLARTPELDNLLRDIHPHFHNKSKNLYFMVLTQSCDLVLRDGIACKAPYITIAPVRPLDAVVHREIKQLQLGISSDAPVLTDKARAKMQQFLGRLFNNNEPGYFFLEAADTELPEDCCAFINLSIALKAELHYQTCLTAKRLQLTEAFQAKLGWLVAQMFSRVGTADWPSADLGKKVQAILRDAAVWVPDDRAQAVQQEFETKRAVDPAVRLTGLEISEILKKIPSKKAQVLSQAKIVLAQALATRPDADTLVTTIMKRLTNDAGLTALLPK